MRQFISSIPFTFRILPAHDSACFDRSALQRLCFIAGSLPGVIMQSVLCHIVLLLLAVFCRLASGAQEYAFLNHDELALNKRLLQQQ
ncbi:hypothetical protein EPIR_3691 [Erwinia piriflorinigrans CFBP 5888]|uniref:Uncharacterized protein n=1 Tax=Erwinia piriflorinigrans CFBP 5888 TaxID=1161919 RepID=V5ZDE8_9GAMM|nr:hypothetical protein EPIR_3691 [Erwinia piriflorinigrans CFBP 5888]